MPFVLVLAADHEARDVLQEHERDAALRAQLDEVRALLRRLREQDAVVGDDPDRIAVQMREARDERCAIARLELVERGRVDDPRDDLAHVVRLARVARDHAVELFRVVERRPGGRTSRPTDFTPLRLATTLPRDVQRVRVVLREMVGDARDARVHVAAAQLLGGHFFAGGRLHQRRAAQEDRALVLDDDRLVRHRGHVRAAGRARAHHHRDLRDGLGGHRRLVVEDAAEMVAVGKHVVLGGQERAAGIHEVNARQPVLQRDFLRAQVLLHRHRIVGAALHRRVVGDDHAFAAGHPADARDDACGGNVAAVHAVRGQRRQLEDRRAGIDQRVDPVARQQLAAGEVLLPRLVAAAARDLRGLLAQVGHERTHRVRVGAEIIRA